MLSCANSIHPTSSRSTPRAPAGPAPPGQLQQEHYEPRYLSHASSDEICSNRIDARSAEERALVTRHGSHCFDQSKHVRASSARHSADEGVKCKVKWAYRAIGACPEERQGAHLWSIDHVKTAAQHAQPQWSRVLRGNIFDHFSKNWTKRGTQEVSRGHTLCTLPRRCSNNQAQRRKS